MEVKVVENKKNRLVFEAKGDTKVPLEILRSELWDNEHVNAVGVNTEHPLLDKQSFVLETDGTDPKKVITASAKKLTKVLDKSLDSLKLVK
ncbi:RpoL/Rpb11 RNA polymerase subunit family protein [Nanoarchaeota archaeon]